MSKEPFPLSRRLLAEALGTGILVAAVIGSGIMAERLSGGNQAIALLGNTIPTGAILVVIITILGPISGAHFNPAVTLVFAGRGEFPWGEVMPYVVVQCLGGICGTVLAHLMFELAPLAIGTTTRRMRETASIKAECQYKRARSGLRTSVVVRVMTMCRQRNHDDMERQNIGIMLSSRSVVCANDPRASRCRPP